MDRYEPMAWDSRTGPEVQMEEDDSGGWVRYEDAQKKIDHAYAAGMLMEKKLLRARLGLAVASDG